MSKPIHFHPRIIDNFPNVRLGVIECPVSIMPSDEPIHHFSKNVITQLKSELVIETVSQKETIKSTKDAYRTLGKDPSRYRPSAEALTRRIINGKDLYWINSIVDILNLISLESGFSIGGYDTDKINGPVEFGVGQANEHYEAIGRGKLNIENLPLFRDQTGAFGSPTSDSTRTMVNEKTRKFLMIIIDFSGHQSLESTMQRSAELYRKFAGVRDMSSKIISTKD